MQVYFVLSGEDAETDARLLDDKERKVLHRGSTCTFLMTTPEYVSFSINYR